MVHRPGPATARATGRLGVGITEGRKPVQPAASRREISLNRWLDRGTITAFFPATSSATTPSELGTPRYAWCRWDLGDQEPSKPNALPRTLSRALKMTVATVIAGQVHPIRTTVAPCAQGRRERAGSVRPRDQLLQLVHRH